MITRWSWAPLEWYRSKSTLDKQALPFAYALIAFCAWAAGILSWNHPPMFKWVGSFSFWSFVGLEGPFIISILGYAIHKLPRAVRWIMPHRETVPQHQDLRQAP